MGAVFTALIHWSSAASVLTVALVDAGTLTLRGSLGLLIGAYVDTLGTTWLVSFKLTGIGPYCILPGTPLGFIPHRVHVFGEVLFLFWRHLFRARSFVGLSGPIARIPCDPRPI